MLDILAITTPIYLIILLGFVATRVGMFEKAELRAFGKFVINLALPALLFQALAQRRGDAINGSYLLAYMAGSLLTIALVYTVSRRALGMNPVSSAIATLGTSCSNSGFIGFPILLLVLPDVAGVSLALGMIVENAVVIPLVLAIAESGRNKAGGRWQILSDTAARLVRNPMMIAMAAGLAVSLASLPMPAPLLRTVGLVAQASGALSLFVIGGALVGLPLRRMAVKVAPIGVAKLLLHPLCVLLAVMALPWVGLAPLDPHLRTAALLMAAMPMASVYPILSHAYGLEERSAAALMLTTVGSFFTLSGLLWLLR